MRSLHCFFIIFGISVAALLTTKCGAQQPTKDGAAPSLSVNWLYGAYIPRDVPLEPLTGRQRVRLYTAQSFTTPGIYIKAILFSSGDQIHGTPGEWGGGVAGYGRRLGSRYGQYLIQNTLASTGNAFLGYEPRYDRCRCTGLWPRTRHAFLRNFITYNRTESQRRPQLALYAGAFGSGAISSLWYPGYPKPWVEGYQSMVTQAGWGLATNWVGEFAPEINRIVKRKKTR